jgi:hypothetical protein
MNDDDDDDEFMYKYSEMFNKSNIQIYMIIKNLIILNI